MDFAAISSASHAGAADPRLDVDARGKVVAVWTNVTGTTGATRASCRARRGPQTAAGSAPSTSRTGHTSYAARVGLDARGNAIVAEATGAEATITMDRRGTAIATWGRDVLTGDGYDAVVQAAVMGHP